MSAEKVHPLELAFLEAIESLEGAIKAALEAQAAAASATVEATDGGGRSGRSGGGGDDIIVLGVPWWIPPNARVTHLPYPWEDPSGWTSFGPGGGQD